MKRSESADLLFTCISCIMENVSFVALHTVNAFWFHGIISKTIKKKKKKVEHHNYAAYSTCDLTKSSEHWMQYYVRQVIMWCSKVYSVRLYRLAGLRLLETCTLVEEAVRHYVRVTGDYIISKGERELGVWRGWRRKQTDTQMDIPM